MEALKLSKSINDEVAESGTLRWLGNIHWRMGDYHLALEYLDEGLKKSKKLGDRNLEGILHIEMGNAYSGLGDLDESSKHFEIAIKILEKVGDTGQHARALNNLGDNYMQRGEWLRASDLFMETKQVAADDINMRAWGAFNRAECFVQLKRYDDAKIELDEAIPLLEQSGDLYGIAGALQILGQVFSRMGKWDLALGTLEHARETSRKTEMPVSEAKIIRDIGRTYMWKGEKGEARKNLELARNVFKEYCASKELELVEKDLKELDS
jgi:tetratricopeptide (TPR) repeat protein